MRAFSPSLRRKFCRNELEERWNLPDLVSTIPLTMVVCTTTTDFIPQGLMQRLSSLVRMELIPAIPFSFLAHLVFAMQSQERPG